MRAFLDGLHREYHRREYLHSDPLEFVHRYSDPWDREAVALPSALLAYGNVRQIRRSVEGLLTRISAVSVSPSDFIRGLSDPKRLKEARKALESYVHRFNRGPDLVLLFKLLNRSWARYGSLGGHFLRELEPDAPDFSLALNALIRDWRSWAGKEGQGSFRYLLTAPEDGSCCKRWCMLLRWMGRVDGLDLGLWGRNSSLAGTFPHGRWLRPSQLVMPLDTHTGRISQYLALTRRKTIDWKTAVEVTESLRRSNPEDPVKYDFALARLGILDRCQRKYRAEICAACQLRPVCRFALTRRASTLDSALPS